MTPALTNDRVPVVHRSGRGTPKLELPRATVGA
jgi:hypothetical protein